MHTSGVRRTLVIFSIVALILTPQLGVASELVLPSSLNAGWLATVNYYRLSSGVAPLTEDPSLSNSAAKHVNYLLKTDPSLRTVHTQANTRRTLLVPITAWREQIVGLISLGGALQKPNA